jgi:NitT/TauT family transport system substrate-binding protein
MVFAYFSAFCPLLRRPTLRTKYGWDSAPSAGLHSATWVAEQRGFYRKYGIDAEIIVTGQGGTAGIGALLANDIQMVSSAGDLLAAAALRGGDTVMIAAVINKGFQRILTVPEIKTPADLKGKRVGVTRIGAVSHVVLQMMLQR